MYKRQVHGLATRGHIDENSNYHALLELVAEDNSNLSSWVQRTKYRWLSHDITNELGSIMANEVLQNLIKFLKDSQYYSIIMDETSDACQHLSLIHIYTYHFLVQQGLVPNCLCQSMINSVVSKMFINTKLKLMV